MDVQAKSRQHLSDLCHMRLDNFSSIAGVNRGRATRALRIAAGKKKRREIPPLANRPAVSLVVLGATPGRCNESLHGPVRTVTPQCVLQSHLLARVARSPSHADQFDRSVDSAARLSSPLRETRGFATLPRGRCACSSGQLTGCRYFYTGSTCSGRELNLFPAPVHRLAQSSHERAHSYRPRTLGPSRLLERRCRPDQPSPGNRSASMD